MTTFYDNDQLVGEVTRAILERTGSKLLQFHRFSPQEEAHTTHLLTFFDPKQNARIADIGCGVGAMADWIKYYREDLEFILVNKSDEQLRMCPEIFEKRPGTAEQLPLAPGEVDAIMAAYVLGHVDRRKFILECDRVLAAGDHVYIYDLFAESKGDNRLELDLQYSEMTVNGLIGEFNDGGFNYGRQAATRFLPEEFRSILPRPDTLNRTVSVALIFEKR